MFIFLSTVGALPPLLEAELKEDRKLVYRSWSLRILLTDILFREHQNRNYMCFKGTEHATTITLKFKFVIELLQQLLKRSDTADHDCYAFNVMVAAAKKIFPYEYADRKLTMFNTINILLEGYGDNFRCLMLSGTGMSNLARRWDSCSSPSQRLNDDKCLFQSFIVIAGYSSRPNHSTVLIRLILDSMSTII